MNKNVKIKMVQSNNGANAQNLSDEIVPKWNLSSIYSDIFADDYNAELCEYKKSIETQKKLLCQDKSIVDCAQFADWLLRYVTAWEQTASLATTLNAYVYALYSTNTTNAKALKALSELEEIAISDETNAQKFATVLYANAHFLDDACVAKQNLLQYKALFLEMIAKSKHYMSQQEEALAIDLQRTGGNAWARLHEQILSFLKDENGKTFNALRNDAYSSNASLRKSSYEKELKLLQNNAIALAACLNNLKGETITLNKRRGWQSALERALFASRLQEKTLGALICAIEENLPNWQKYLQTKARLLKKMQATASTHTDENGIAFYDLFAPLPNPQNVTAQKDISTNAQSLTARTWTFAEAKNYIIEQYVTFSDKMADFAKNAFEQNWIDAQIYEGKVGGAYDQDIPKGHQSRILANFTGAFSDVITLAHEIGHAYHFSTLQGKSPLLFDYPMTLAETASTFAETIVKQNALCSLDGFEKINLLELDLQDTCQVLVDILSRFYFEKSVFEKRANDELSSDDFCALMTEAQRKAYGAGLNSEMHPFMWAVKCHYYSTGLDFYNFPYAFGQLFAVALYGQSKKIDNFAKSYDALLSETGSLSCEELCLRAGFDITQKDFWQQGLNLYNAEIDQFVTWAQNYL